MAYWDLSLIQLCLELLDQVSALCMWLTKKFFDRLQSVSRFFICLSFIHKLALLYALNFIVLSAREALSSPNWANSRTGRTCSYTFVLRKEPFQHLGRLLSGIFLRLCLHLRLWYSSLLGYKRSLILLNIILDSLLLHLTWGLGLRWTCTERHISFGGLFPRRTLFPWWLIAV